MREWPDGSEMVRSLAQRHALRVTSATRTPARSYHFPTWGEMTNHEHEEHTMEKISMQAPGNPFREQRNHATAFYADGDMGYSLAVGNRSGDHGPGLLGEDLDAIARRAHAAGVRKADGEAQERERKAAEEHRFQLADAYDAGYTAGKLATVRELMRALRRRVLSDVHFPLMAVESGPKSKVAEGLAQVRSGVSGFVEHVDALLGDDDAARAAAAEDVTSP